MNKAGFIFLTGSSHPALSQSISAYLSQDVGKCRTFQKTSRETHVDIRESVRGKDVFILQSGSTNPNNDLMELLQLVYACKTSSSGRIIGVMPYLPYSGQSKMAKRGSIVCKLVAKMLGKAGMDHLITLDLHQKEIQGFFNFPVDNLRAVALLLQYVQEKIPNWQNSVMVARHPGATNRATSYAERLRVGIAVIHGDHSIMLGVEERQREMAGRQSPPNVESDEENDVKSWGESSEMNNNIVAPRESKACILHKSTSLSSSPPLPSASSSSSSPLAMTVAGASATTDDASKISAVTNLSTMKTTTTTPATPTMMATTTTMTEGREPFRSVHFRSLLDVKMPRLRVRCDSEPRNQGRTISEPQREFDDAESEGSDTESSKDSKTIGAEVNDERPGLPKEWMGLGPNGGSAGAVGIGGSGVGSGSCETIKLKKKERKALSTHQMKKTPHIQQTQRTQQGLLELYPTLVAKSKFPINVVGNVKGKIAILIDCVIDEVEGFVIAANVLKQHGASKVYVMATHGIFSADAARLIDESVIDEVVVTNTVPHIDQKLESHKIKTVDVSVLLSEAIRRIHYGESMQQLFKNVSILD